jgi:polysaccharide export outer membrane protein
MTKAKQISALIAVWCLLFSGAARPQDPAAPPAPATAAPGHIIGPEDTLTISVVDAEELNKAWRVSPAGEVTLPMVGRMQAAGMTVDEFQASLTEKLRKYYLNPQVNAFISEVRSQPITITGPVEKPGTYQLEGARTLLDIVSMAGGPKDTAGSTVTLTRGLDQGPINYPGARLDETGKYHMIELPLQDVTDGHSLAAAIPVRPYDVISVSPVKAQRLVHIAGEVIKPGAVELVSQNTVSLMKVVAVAGGLTRTASPRKTLIMHINSQGVQTSTAFINLGKIMSGKAKDLELSPGDIVVVPSNTVMSYVQAASLSTLSTGIYILGRF